MMLQVTLKHTEKKPSFFDWSVQGGFDTRLVVKDKTIQKISMLFFPFSPYTRSIMDRWGQSRRRPGSPFGGQRGGGYHGYANPGGPPPIVTGGPPLFPSAYPSAAPHHHPGPLGAFSANEPRFRDSSSPSEATTGSSCEEQLFPPGKVADLEKNLQKQNDHTFIGKSLSLT